MSQPDRPHAGRTIAESVPPPAAVTRPPDGSPNVVVIVLDDLGFGQLGCFGSDLDTPAIDDLAAAGVRYNRFHVTAMCSPTRAALLTGRNHHAVGMGFLPDLPTRFDGYTGRIPPTAAALPRLLRDAGWSTFAVGKWHLAPRWDQSASGPFSHWPLGLGFERYYGFLNGDTNQWTPDLVRDNGFVDAPAGPDDGYHVTEDLADQAIRLIRDQQHATPDKPFLLYFATGAVHAPHQAPPDYIDAYAGRFDKGWDAWREGLFARQLELGVVPAGTQLTERPPWVPAWDDLGADEQRLFARFMECFAGFLTHADAQIGRLLAFLDEIGEAENTLVMLISDNGTSAEGGPHGSFNEQRFTHDRVDDLAETMGLIDELGGHRAYNHYPWGWAWAGNTPLRLWKRYTWLGGVRTPLIARWPARIADAGSVRPQFAHAVDLFATVLDACGVDVPPFVDGHAQQPVDGASLLATFDDADAPAPRRSQYFELLGSRAMYLDGWKATTDHVGRQLTVEREALVGSLSFETDRWSLFRLEDDFSEAVDVADEHPDVVRRLEQHWWAEAGRNGVLPMEDSFLDRISAMAPDPYPSGHRTTYRPGGGGIIEDALPPMGGGFLLTAEVHVDDRAGTPEGIVCALGDWNNGWAWYLLDGRPVAAFNLFSHLTRVAAPDEVPSLGPGDHELGLEYERQGDQRTLRLRVDHEVVAEGELPEDLPFRWQIGGGGLLIGRDVGFPVSDDYRPPFPITAELRSVTFEIPMLAPRPEPSPAEQRDRAIKRE